MAKSKIKKDWWKDFFSAIAGEVMFDTRKEAAYKEIDEIIKRTKVKKGARILDLACGAGRHSIAFAEKGFQVDGLDYSKIYIQEAQKKSKKLSKPPQFVRGDMRAIDEHFEKNSFDLIVSLFNSFGYFDKRSDDKKVLRQVFKALKPGGQFVLNTLHEGGVKVVLQNPISRGFEPLPKFFMIDQATYDPKKKRTTSNWTLIDTRKSKTQIERHSFGQNVYGHAELKKMLREAGFQIQTVWGLLHGTKFHSKVWHQTIVAKKPK